VEARDSSSERRQPTQGTSRLGDAGLFLAAAAALVYPLVLAYARYGPSAPFKFFASDAFYYLNIARRSQGLPFFTYDGEHPTNGFHPLWQWSLAGLFRLAPSPAATDGQLLLTYAVCGALAAVGVGLIAVSASRLTGSRPLALLLTVPGAFELALSRSMTSTIDGTEAAPYFVANGMESSLSLFLFGGFVWMLMRWPRLETWPLSRYVLVSAWLSLVMLSRLDDVFLLVAFTSAALLATRGRQPASKVLAAVGAVPSLTLGAYLAYNYRTTHLLLPVSGSMKRDLGAFPSNLRSAVETLLPTKLLRTPELFMWDALNWRSLQLLVPMLVAAAFVVRCCLTTRSTEDHPTERRSTLLLLCGYVLLKGGYNLVTVPLLGQGHWYFALSIASMNLVVTHEASRWLSLRRPALVPSWHQALIPLLRGLGLLALGLGALQLLSAHEASRVLFAVALVGSGAAIAWLAPRIAARARGLEPATWRRAGTAFASVAAAAYLLMYGNAVVNQKVDAKYAEASFEFWKARERISAELAVRARGAKLFELDDGVMAYALSIPTMSGTGLATDRDAYERCRAQRCLDVAYERGYRLVSSVQYWGYINEQRRGFERPKDEAELLELLVGTKAFDSPSGAQNYRFSLLFAANVGKYVVYFLELSPRPAD
jgi:hypothetical protein